MPSDVDEAEFEMLVEGPEGMSLAAMDEALQAIDREIRAVPGVQLALLVTGAGGLARVNQGNGYIRIAPHEERTVTLHRLWEGLRHGDPLAAFRGNYAQRDVMQQVRQRMRKFSDMRISIRNIPGFNIGGGNFDIDFVLRGPDLEALARYGDELRRRAVQMGGMLDLTTTLRLDRPELRVQIDRERAADLRVDTEQIATALRLMVGGDQEVSRFRDPSVNEDYDVQLRLREADRKDLRTISRLYVSRAGTAASEALGAAPQVGLAPGGGLVRLDNLVKIVAGPDGAARRPLRPPAGGPAAGLRGARVRVGRSDRGPPRGGGRHEPAARLLVQRLRAGQRVREDLQGVPVGLPARRDLHVHDPGLAVREPDPSAHHPARPAPVRAVCPVLAVVYGQYPESLLRPRHPRALRHRQEELDPPDRPDERAAPGRPRSRRAPSSRAIATGSGPILMTTLALVAGMLPLWVGTGPGPRSAAPSPWSSSAASPSACCSPCW